MDVAACQGNWDTPREITQIDLIPPSAATGKDIGMNVRKTTTMQSALRAVVVLCLFAGGYASAQQGNWDPIPADELALKEEPQAAGAAAVILSRTLVTDDKQGVISASVRIKVLTEPGTKYADIQIPYSSWMKVDSIEARTIRPDGTTVPFSGTIHDKIVAKYGKYEVATKTFTLPDVHPDSIIEYRYRAHWKKEEQRSHVWDVQGEMFTRKAHFELHPMSPNSVRWDAQNLTQKPQLSGDRYVLDTSNVPALEKEENTLPESELRQQVTFTPRHEFYDSPETYWGRIAEYEGQRLNEFIGKSNRVRNVVASVAPPADPPEVRLRKVYSRCQQIRKIAESSFDSEEGRKEKLKENKHADDVVERGYGTIGDITALFVAMGREVGYQSGFVFITDRRLGLFHPDILSTSQLDATLAWAQKDNQFLLLDPSCEKCPFGLISWDQSGANGIRTNYTGGSVFVKIPANKPDDAVIQRKGSFTLAADGTLSGEFTVAIGGLDALELRNKEEKPDETARKKTVTDRVKGWLPDSADVKLLQLANWDDIDKPIIATIAASVPGFAAATSKRLMVPAWVFSAKEQDPFPHQQRKFAVVFENPYKRSDDLTIKLPTGYQVETIPENMKASDVMLDYSLTVENKGDTLHLSRNLTGKAVYVPTNLYTQLRYDYRLVKASDEKQAILRQATTASR
jgi:hypothetical protein